MVTYFQDGNITSFFSNFTFFKKENSFKPSYFLFVLNPSFFLNISGNNRIYFKLSTYIPKNPLRIMCHAYSIFYLSTQDYSVESNHDFSRFKKLYYYFGEVRVFLLKFDQFWALVTQQENHWLYSYFLFLFLVFEKWNIFHSILQEFVRQRAFSIIAKNPKNNFFNEKIMKKQLALALESIFSFFQLPQIGIYIVAFCICKLIIISLCSCANQNTSNQRQRFFRKGSLLLFGL